MSDRKFPPLVAAIIGFALGALAVKLAARFCPFCRTSCCGGEAENCCCAEDGAGDCCCGEGESCDCREGHSDSTTQG